MAMEPFDPFPQELIHGDSSHFWVYSPELPPDDDFVAAFSNIPQDTNMLAADPAQPAAVRRSAFEMYARSGNGQPWRRSNPAGEGGRNIHRRVIDMVRRIPKPLAPPRPEVEMSREYRHMMRERQRREKLSQSYADLYSMVSSRSKNDKNSIVQSAAAYIHELKGLKKSLQRRNEELKGKVLGSNDMSEVTKIEIRMANPSSPIDSMICTLQCLQRMDVKAKAIRSDLSGSEFSAIMSVKTKMAAADVERAVEGALMMEEEKKIQWQHPATNPCSQQCQVENMICELPHF